jgi:DNA repair exonuclease SbcCD nuclease subunit
MPQVRFIHFADVHLGYRFGTVDPDTAAHRRDDQITALDYIVQTAKDDDAQFVLVSGDLFDSTQPSPRTVAAVRRACCRLAEAGIRTFIIPGNHDEYETGGLWDRETLDAHVFRQPQWEGAVLDDLDVTIYGIAFDREHQDRNVIADFDQEPQTSKAIALVHATYDAGLIESEQYHRFTLDDLRALPVNYAALGHFHRQISVLDEPQRKAAYPGTPCGLDFAQNDLGPRTIVSGCIEDDGRVAVTPREVPVPQLAVCDIDCTGASKESVWKQIDEVADDQTHVKVNLAGAPSAELASELGALEDQYRDVARSIRVERNYLSLTDVPEDNVYLKAFAAEMKQRLAEADDEQKPVLRQALQLGTTAFLQGGR